MTKETGPVMTGDLLNERTLGLRRPEVLRYTRKTANVCEKTGQPGYGCKVDLDIIDEERAIELGLPKETRAVIHKCVRAGSTEGEYVPVKNEHEALRVTKDFCGCVEKQAETTRAKCARKKD